MAVLEDTTTESDLSTLLNPCTVAVIGAFTDRSRIAGPPIKLLTE